MRGLFNKFTLGFIAVVSLVMISCGLTLYFAIPGSFNLMEEKVSARDFQKIPFDTLDASEACRLEAEGKFAGEFLRSTVDWHSTRYQEDRGFYVVALQADIGTRETFTEAIVYCYINPRTYKVSYFKAYDGEDKPMLSNGINFADMLKSFKL